MNRVLLIDADLAAYRSSSATESVWEFGEGGETTVVTDIEEAKKSAEHIVESYRKALAADEVILCLSDLDGGNFRKELAPTIYKVKRAEVRRPENLVPVKRWLAERYRSYQRPRLEGDDVAGILATHPTLIPGNKIIVSDDKDMKQIPGKLYVPRTGEKLKITELDADRWHMQQTLTGDPTDGYKGCPRVGPKSPFVARVNEETTVAAMWSIVVEAYTSKGLTADDALLNARLARILRWSDYDKDAKAPRLWSPPTP